MGMGLLVGYGVRNPIHQLTAPQAVFERYGKQSSSFGKELDAFGKSSCLSTEEALSLHLHVNSHCGMTEFEIIKNAINEGTGHLLGNKEVVFSSINLNDRHHVTLKYYTDFIVQQPSIVVDSGLIDFLNFRLKGRWIVREWALWNHNRFTLIFVRPADK